MNAEAAELHLLSGAYVLNALDEDERAEFERHLSQCAACAAEVGELAETAARLGSAVAVPPPPEMRHRLLRTIATVRQDPPAAAPGSARRAGPRLWRAGRLALAASVAAAAALGGAAVWQWQEAREAEQRVEQAREEASRLARVLSAADATTTSGRLPDGARAIVVASRAEDRAAFVASALPAPPDGMVYQLWFADDGAMRPAGLLDPEATQQALLMDGPLAEASGMGITVEPAGGSRQPTSEPLAVLAFGS
ncbi:anti-sigma factor [Streptomyces marincola]|uniref:anti-sigma factor n=1 Tax=Streptomyces marincola TaxID=2878388 RepID=UPI001CF539AF|nr:anti-sigma factor [Streptomyces marincola]UCM90492.1 anti-sigma factor [Streptomyces marincola]